MGFPLSGPVDSWSCDCDDQGTSPVNTGQQYVVSINGLQGITRLLGTGAVTITSVGNDMTVSLSASAGLGSVTSVALASGNSNLTVVSGSPITTNGTITLNLAGNVGSIAGLTMAADKMLYATGVATFATTDLVANARTLLGHTFSQMRSDLGLVIGTNVQAWSADLDSFVTAASWVTDDLTLTGDLSIAGNWVGGGTGSFAGALTVTGLISGGGGGSFSGNVDAGTFSGNGASITGLSAANVSTGTLAVARGGTNIASYAVGDIIYASAGTTLSKLADVSVGSYLRSGGVTTAPLWSTLKLPNSATTGDLFYANSANNMTTLADVATGNALISGGVGVAFSWGKITASHTDGSLAASNINADIAELSALTLISSDFLTTGQVTLGGIVNDGTLSPGSNGYILTSTGTGVQWTNQIFLDTIRVDVAMSMEATVTAGGVTGNQTINKALGSVNIAAGGSSITVTNSLVDASSCVFCQIATNDTTAIIKNVVASSGQFVIRTTAAVTAETRINFFVLLPT